MREPSGGRSTHVEDGIECLIAEKLFTVAGEQAYALEIQDIVTSIRSRWIASSTFRIGTMAKAPKRLGHRAIIPPHSR